MPTKDPGYQSTRHTVISSHGHVVTRSTRHRLTRLRHVSSHSQLVTSEHITKPPGVGLKRNGTTGHLATRGSASRYMARRKATRQATELTTV